MYPNKKRKMGNLFCSDCCKNKDYSEGDKEGNFIRGVLSFDDFASSILKQYDSKATIFEGANLDQKFTSKTTYEPRFVWVNLDSLTIHMSQHNTKERRHKEASLADVTNVERGAPKRLKSTDDKEFDGVCMTVNFQRGGGIDLKFKTAAECDVWYSVLTKVVTHLKTDSKKRQ